MNYIQLIRSYTRYIGYSIVHSFSSGLGQTFFISLFIPHMRDHFYLTDTQSGWIYGSATLLASLTLPIVGRQIDHMNLRAYSALTGFLLFISTFIVGMAGHVVLLFIGLVGLRLSGQSLMSHISATTMARYFGKLRGKALGISSLGFPLSEAILPLFGVQLILLFGWQKSYMILGLLFLVFFFPATFLLVGKNDPFVKPSSKAEKEVDDSAVSHMNRRQALKTPFLYMALPLAILPPFLATGFFYIQASLASYKGWTLQWIASCFVGFAIGRILGSFSIGPVIDRMTAIKIYPYHLIPLALGLGVLALFAHPLAGLAYLSLFGMSIGFETNIKSALWAEAYGTKHLGAIRSMTLTVMIFSTAIAPVLFGWLIDKGFDLNSMAWIAIGSIVVCSFLAFVAPIPKRRHLSN